MLGKNTLMAIIGGDLMSIKKTTPEDVEAFIKATEEARKIKPSREDIDKLNEIMKDLEVEEQKKKKRAMHTEQV